MRKKIILLVLALIAGIVLFSFSLLIAKEIEKNKQQEKRIVEHKQKTVKPVNQEEPENTQTKEQPKDFQDEPKQAEEIDTSDWGIFINNTYNYKIKYPKKLVNVGKFKGRDFALAFDSKATNIGTDGLIKSGFQVNVRVWMSNKSLDEEYYQVGILTKTVKKTNIFFENNEAIKYKYISNTYDIYEGIYIAREGYVYNIYCRYPQESLEGLRFFEKMLSTFEFF